MNDDDLRKQAWDFFELQASQRLTTFNFYIATASLLITGMIAGFHKDVNVPLLGVPVGLLLTVLSLAFWKLDQRNRDLIKSAEESLKHFEKTWPNPEPNGPHAATRFLREEHQTAINRNGRTWQLWKNQYSYSECFRLVFFAFAGVGIIGAGYSILHAAWSWLFVATS